jgi:alpha-aminoadipate carrier protein LysW
MSVLTATQCPVCGGNLETPTDVVLGELLDCGDCGSELEVTAIAPALQVSEAPMSAEDWGE